MNEVIGSFAQFMGPVFFFLVVGLIWDHVIRAFRGWL